MSHKSGFVNIIGNPNVGKSTLMNALLGEKLSIITSKVQTTRHRIIGIDNGENYQIVYSDTPGIIDPNYKLQESMMDFVREAVLDADIFLFVTDVNDNPVKNSFTAKLIESGLPVIVIVNKIDLSTQENVVTLIKKWETIFTEGSVIPVSAFEKVNLESIKQTILEQLPENPPYYSKDDLTDRNVRFFVSEIIREKILLNFQKEIPYSVEVAIDQYKEKKELIYISGIIFVERESQKAIILGHNGKAIKKLGSDARMDIEKFVGSKIFLELTVKVKKNWRDDELQLKRFGYQ